MIHRFECQALVSRYQLSMLLLLMRVFERSLQCKKLFKSVKKCVRKGDLVSTIGLRVYWAHAIFHDK